jgi:phage terminase small subunit
MAKRDITIKPQHVNFVNKYVETEDVYAAARFAGVKEHQLDATVAKWRDHPTILAMIKQRKAEVMTDNGISIDWIAAELKEIYLRDRGDGNLDGARKTLDMLAKHKGFYAADKNPSSDKPMTVVITNYAGAKVDMHE